MGQSDKYILLVEDDNGISHALKWILEYEGYRVSVANNGKEALDVIQNHQPPFLIMLDLLMPIMDGFEFRDNIKSKLKISNIPTVIFSATSYTENPIEALPHEIVIKKPIDVNLLLNIIQKYH